MTEETLQCGRCNRNLKDSKSRKRGYGPVCYKKIQEAEQKREEGAEADVEKPVLHSGV